MWYDNDNYDDSLINILVKLLSFFFILVIRLIIEILKKKNYEFVFILICYVVLGVEFLVCIFLVNSLCIVE